jgi:MoxR-like ATPase
VLDDAGKSGKKIIRNACGHDWAYNVHSERTADWLKTKPCPPCQREGWKPDGKQTPSPTPQEQPQEQAPQPKPEPTPPPEPEVKPDEAWVEGVLEVLPKAALFHEALPQVILATRAGVPVWLQGPPGTAKSTLAEQTATALEMGFYPTSCHELMTRSDLFGYTDAVGKDHRTPLWDAYELGGILLLDEVDNGNPNLLAALNSALSNGHCVFGSGTVVQRHPDFRVIATANTAGLGPEAGFVGRNGVDLATRDRFVTIMVLIDDNLELALASLHSGASIDEFTKGMRRRAKLQLNKQSVAHQKEQVGPDKVITLVRKLRHVVSSRFSGSVVSPRVTIHAAALVAAGFTLDEALRAKLVGLDPAEINQVMKGLE